MSDERNEPHSAELDALLEHEPCGHILTDMDGTVLRANAAIEEMTGYPRSELLGLRRFQDLLTAPGRVFFETHLRPLLHMQGFVREIALDIACTDGTARPVLINCVIRPDADGGRPAIQAVVFDATERRAYEQELLVTARRFERLQRVASVFAAALTEEEIAHETLDEIVDDIKADRGLLALLDPSGERLVVVSAAPGRGGVADAWSDLRVADCEPVAEAIRRAEPGFIEGGDGRDQNVPTMNVSGPTPTRLAILPLTVDDRAIGVLCLWSASLVEFKRDEQLFLVSFTHLVAQALERGRLFRAERSAIARVSFLSSLSRALEEGVELADRAQCVVDMLVPDHADFATIEIPALGPRPVAARHRDPELLAPLLDLHERSRVSEDTPLSMARARATGEPQLLSDITEEMYAAHTADEEQLALLRRLAPRSYLGLPLRARGEIVGALLLAMAGSSGRFTSDDLPFYVEIADRAALALENARLLGHEREVAHRLQMSLLPQSLPTDGRMSLGALYLPGTELMQIGGDWYDGFWLSDSRVGIVVGDVVGHDIDAAVVMGQVRTALRAFALDGGGPGVTLERLSRFARSVHGAFATTVAYAELELDTREMRYACAGHIPPVVFGPRKEARFLWDGRSTPLGVHADEPPSEGTVRLEDEEGFLLVTDGLIERRERPIEAGLEHLLEALGGLLPAEPGLFVDRLAAVLLEGTHQADDVCVLGVFPARFGDAGASSVSAGSATGGGCSG